MSETELQELSRQAAGCLPENMVAALDFNTGSGNPSGHWYGVWLHEHTEACCEVMVRVLLNERHTLEMNTHGKDIWFRGRPSAADFRSDPMLAFRVAVLRALVALKP